jgi:hypothetical protein
MPEMELAAQVSATLREVRELTVVLKADVLLYFIDMAILEADEAEKKLTDQRLEP